MNLKTVVKTWFEAVQVRGYGCKLADTYNNEKEAQIAINESNERAVKQGFKAEEYYIMLCNCTRLFDENNDVVSETITRARV